MSSNKGRMSYFISEGLNSTFKNGLMSVASTSVLVACLIIMGSFFMVSSNISAMLKDLEMQNEIVIFLEDSVSEEMARNMKERFTSMNNIRSAEFVSKDAAFEDYKSRLPNGQDLMETLPENPLRHSYRLLLDDVSLMRSTVKMLENTASVARVRGNIDVSQNLIEIQNILSLLMAWIFIILLLISIFIISNTIKVAMFARRREINIMKHVGATDWFIRWPFIVEGLLIGIFSAGLSFVLLYYGYNYISDKVLSGIDILTLMPFTAFMPEIMIVFGVAGLVIGVFSSIISVRKYLNA